MTLGHNSVMRRELWAFRSDSRATVPPPFFGLCNNGPGEPDEGGAIVLFAGGSPFGPPSTGNTVQSVGQSGTFLDCGVDNVVK